MQQAFCPQPVWLPSLHGPTSHYCQPCCWHHRYAGGNCCCSSWNYSIGSEHYSMRYYYRHWPSYWIPKWIGHAGSSNGSAYHPHDTLWLGLGPCCVCCGDGLLRLLHSTLNWPACHYSTDDCSAVLLHPGSCGCFLSLSVYGFAPCYLDAIFW